MPPVEQRQQRIDTWLSERRPDLASMYRSAIRLLDVPPASGEEQTRVSHICHSMREVMNRVLTVAGTTASPRIRPSTDEQVQALPDLLSRHPDLSLDGQGDSVPVPREVAVVFDKLMRTAVQEKRRSRDDVASLLTDDLNREHLAVKRWMESRRFFVKWAHLRATQIDAAHLPRDNQIRDHIEVFEELFDGVTTAFFTLRRSIDDLLEDINAEEGDRNEEEERGEL